MVENCLEPIKIACKKWYSRIYLFSVVNECTTSQFPLCEQKCVDLPKDYKCECYEGFALDKDDKKSCHDIDECEGEWRNRQIFNIWLEIFPSFYLVLIFLNI